MAIQYVPGDETIRVSFAIYKPLKGYDIDDAVARITKSIASLELLARGAKTAILKGASGLWAAVFILWKGALNEDDSAQNHPGAAEFARELASGVVKMVDSGCFQLSSQEHKHMSFAQLRIGDIVSLRRIYSSSKKQDVLAYCCLALLKAYFKQINGILSYTFYKSMDGRRIFGLGIWDSVESASALLPTSKGSPAEAYWKGLGAKMLKYEVAQVVYVTEETKP